ncbi:MAG: TolC family protein [Candidatus Binatia bacterium]|nr:TolC family protein [Candidatus Binatia bacterium]
MFFPAGTAVYRGADIIPELEITYIFLDFERRSAHSEVARRQFAAANFSSNREIQRVIYRVKLGFYEFDAIRALEYAAALNLELARLRASEAALSEAKADCFPVIGIEGLYGAQVVITWPFFEGFSRLNRVRKARTETERQKEIFRSIEFETTNEVWSTYNDYQACCRRYEYGVALLEALEEAYNATRESYDNGLRTIDELLRSERDLSSARHTLIGSRAELLSTAARPGFVMGNVKSAG